LDGPVALVKLNRAKQYAADSHRPTLPLVALPQG